MPRSRAGLLRDPSRFLGLVLVGGPTRSGPTAPEWAAAVRSDWPACVDGFVAACLPEPDAAPLHRWGVGTLLPAGAEAAVAMSVVHEGIAPALEEIAVPTLVVHGARDRIVPLAQGREAAARIPGSELVVLDDAGHVPVLTRPREVARAVDGWWSRVGEGLSR